MKTISIRLFVLVWGLSTVPAIAQPAEEPAGRTYVIVHGAWGGGWAFKNVERLLRAAGHEVYRPTLTGLGERVHLAGPDVDLSTHVQDVVNVLRFEELDEVILVGHSYGGMVITGVANVVPERIVRLVYLDAFVPEDGESLASITGQPITEDGTPMGPVRDGLLVPMWVQEDQPFPRDVPHPIKTLTEPVKASHPVAKDLPTTYILTLDPGVETDMFSMQAERARARGWAYLEMEADHNPHRSKPDELVELLLNVE